MKTKTNYPENANRVKAFLVAELILIQVSLIAGEKSYVKQDSNNTVDSYSGCTKFPIALNVGNACYYLYEVAVEIEYEIEDWMCNIYNDNFNTHVDEEEIELEEWMYNTQHSFWLDLNDIEEPEPAIESWMANPNNWINTTDELLLTSK